MSKILEVIPGGDWFQNSSDKELEASSSDNTELKFIPINREESRVHLTDEEIETFRVLEGIGRL